MLVVRVRHTKVFPVAAPLLPQTGSTAGGPGGKSGGKASKQVPGKVLKNLRMIT